MIGFKKLLFLVFLLTTGVLFLAPFIGIKLLSPSLFYSPQSIDWQIFFELRLPRVITAFVAGGSLAVAGMVFQALFRNPLATPFTLGISSGASCGAALIILFGIGGTVLSTPFTTLGAFGGALAATVLVYALSAVTRSTSGVTMLLAGIAVSFSFSAVLLFLQYLSDLKHSFQIVRWLMGGVEVHGYTRLLFMFPLVMTGLSIIALHLPHLDHFLTGEHLATSRGINIEATRRWLFFATSISVAGVVASCGPIGFIGMMVPHVCRLLIGSNHRRLGPLCFLFGGAFLVVCDTIARVIIAPSEMPVGVLTALLGGPFFLWILLSRGARAGEW
ncbi:MAG: FecCD family ABC transporter permease [Chitinivibrionales bacterium]